MTKNCFCLFEDENKSCVRWCYPPNFTKNFILEWGVVTRLDQTAQRGRIVTKEGVFITFPREMCH